MILDGTEAPLDAGIPADKRELVMHASLMNGEELLMASDSYDDEYEPMTGMYVQYSTDDVERATAIFNGLAEGGQVNAEPHEEFWTPLYAAVTDRFGTPWQISVEAPQEG